MYAIDSSKVKVYGEIRPQLAMKDYHGTAQSHKLRAIAADIGSNDLLLDIDWIRTHQPVCNWVTGTFEWPAPALPSFPPHNYLTLSIEVFASPGKVVTIPTLFDTGCWNSCMCQELAKEIGVAHTYETTPLGYESVGINGQPVAHFGIIELKTRITDVHNTQSRQMLRIEACDFGGSRELIPGMDWLRRNKPVCGWVAGTLRFPCTEREKVPSTSTPHEPPPLQTYTEKTTTEVKKRRREMWTGTEKFPPLAVQLKIFKRLDLRLSRWMLVRIQDSPRLVNGVTRFLGNFRGALIQGSLTGEGPRLEETMHSTVEYVWSNVREWRSWLRFVQLQFRKGTCSWLYRGIVPGFEGKLEEGESLDTQVSGGHRPQLMEVIEDLNAAIHTCIDTLSLAIGEMKDEIRWTEAFFVIEGLHSDSRHMFEERIENLRTEWYGPSG